MSEPLAYTAAIGAVLAVALASSALMAGIRRPDVRAVACLTLIVAGGTLGVLFGTALACRY